MPRPKVILNNAMCFDGYAVRYSLYYDLLKVVYPDITVYVPATKFLTKSRYWVLQSAPREGVRHDEFFRCPFCLSKSFFYGPCLSCKSKWDTRTKTRLDAWGHRNRLYLNRQAEFLAKIDEAYEKRSFSGLKDVVRIGYVHATRDIKEAVRGVSKSLDEFLIARDAECSDVV